MADAEHRLYLPNCMDVRALILNCRDGDVFDEERIQNGYCDIREYH